MAGAVRKVDHGYSVPDSAPREETSDLERQSTPSEAEPLPSQRQGVSQEAQEQPGDVSSQHTNVQLDGWRLYTVQGA
jgi:hypothetical protein